jgi:hypothetical protein
VQAVDGAAVVSAAVRWWGGVRVGGVVMWPSCSCVVLEEADWLLILTNAGVKPVIVRQGVVQSRVKACAWACVRRLGMDDLQSSRKLKQIKHHEPDSRYE